MNKAVGSLNPEARPRKDPTVSQLHRSTCPGMGRLDGWMDIRLWQGGAHSWVNVPVTQLQCVCVWGGFQYSQAIL